MRSVFVTLPVAITVCLSGVLAATQPALATYPGGNGRIAFGMRVNGNVDVYSALPNGNGARRLTTDPSFDACPAYSPDGKEIAFCSGRSGAFEIWAMDQNGNHQRQITHVGGSLTFPDFSPDGTKIAFSGTRPGDKVDHVFVANLDGSGMTALTSEGEGNNDWPARSPDGSKIAFISDRTGIEQVWVMNANGSQPNQLTRDLTTHDQLPDWSPDGTKIAYEADDQSGSGRIFVMNADGSNPHQLTSRHDDFGTAWSPDGTQIAFLRNFGNGDRPVYIMNADGGDQHALIGRGMTLFVPAWQPLSGVHGRGRVQASPGLGSSASFIVTFSSSAPGQGYILFGPEPGCTGLISTATQDAGAGTTHHVVTVTGDEMNLMAGAVLPGATYSFEVLTVAKSGVEIDTNGGTCYSVTVPST